MTGKRASRLAEAGEVIFGVVWWYGAHLWGLIIGAILVLAPVLMANLIVGLFPAMPATVAVAGGIVAAYALGLWPWDAETRLSLLIAIGGTTASVLLWELMRGSADSATLLIALATTVGGWPVRRALNRI